jgi:hypothetical protein
MATSRVEKALLDIIAEFQTVSVANGFRNDVAQVIPTIRHVDEIIDFPEIGIELGDETVTCVDDNWTVFHSVVPVVVIGSIKCETDTNNPSTNLSAAGEALLHDMKRIVTALMAKYVNQSTPGPWNIIPTKEMKYARVPGLGEKRNITLIGVEFQLRIRNQDASFDD